MYGWPVHAGVSGKEAGGRGSKDRVLLNGGKHRDETEEKVLGGGAWPFLVGGVICLLIDNERDLPK